MTEMTEKTETATVQGRIIRALGGFYYIDTPEGLVECRARGVFRKEGVTPYVGDLARAELTGEGKGYLIELLPRKNFLIRPPVDVYKRQAQKLAKLLDGMICHVNLIPVNPVKERGYDRTAQQDIRRFVDTLGRLGVNATVRRELGSDINAACGQLRRQYEQGEEAKA